MPSCPHFMDEATIGQRHEGTCRGSQLVSLRENCSPTHPARGSRCFHLPCSYVSFILENTLLNVWVLASVPDFPGSVLEPLSVSLQPEGAAEAAEAS